MDTVTCNKVVAFTRGPPWVVSLSDIIKERRLSSVQISKFTFKRTSENRNTWEPSATVNNKTAVTSKAIISKIAAVMVEEYQCQKKEETDAS